MRIKIVGKLRTRWSVLVALAISLGLTTITPITQVQAQPFKDRKINVNLPVGTIAGAVSVSNGAATYNIPIALPKGSNGLQPSLSIGYNSMAGNGLLGMGWNLAGLSAITRTPNTKYHNGKIRAVQLDNDDVFALDGNRLFAVNGANGKEGTQYKTEIATFNKITSHGTTGNGPEWFKVETKEGLTITYGQYGAQVKPDGANTAYSWLIKKVYDKFGNYYEYHYRYIYGQAVATEITYCDNRIKFHYTSRKDQNTIYLAGHALHQRALLKSIEVLHNNKQVDKYEFKHQYKELYHYLSEVTRYGSMGTALNSTAFKYGHKPRKVDHHFAGGSDKAWSKPYYLPSNAINWENNKVYHWPGDFNGDGITDILTARRYRYDYKNSTQQTSTSYDWDWSIHFNSGLGTALEANSVPTYVGKGIDERTQVHVTDFNGDGKQDFFIVKINNITPYELDRYTFIPFLSTGNGFQSLPEFKFNDNTAGPASLFTYQLTDLDGDGKQEIFVHEPYSTQVTIVRDGNIHSSNTAKINLGQKYDFSRTASIDLNGDGRTELPDVKILNSRKAYTLQLDGNKFTHIEQERQLKIPHKRTINQITDFNGDGIYDVLFTRIYTPWDGRIRFGVGKLNRMSDYVNTGFKTPGIKTHVKDLNGDGKSDIMVINGKTLDVYFSKGKGFEHKAFTSPLDIQHEMNHKIDFGDFNGDGTQDMMIHRPGLKGYCHFFYFSPNSKSMLLTAVADGFNNVTEIHYNYLTNNEYYKKGSQPIDDNCIEIQHALPVVTHVHVSNGKYASGYGPGGRVTTVYHYQGAKIHRYGKGFLGFSKITQTNYGNDIKTETTYKVDPVYFLNQPASTKTWNMGTWQLISEGEITYDNRPLEGKRVFPYLKQTKVTDKLMEVTTTTDYKYDNNGNQERVKTEIGNKLASTTTHRKFERYGAHIPNKVTWERTIQRRKGETPYVRKTEYKYNPNGTLKKQITDPNNPNELTTTLDYHPNGTLKSKTVSAKNHPSTPYLNVDSRTTRYNYDKYGRFVTETYNAHNQKSSATYDYGRGVVLTKTGIDNLTTTNTYSEFGELQSSTTPDGVTTYYDTKWDIRTGSFNPTEMGRSLYVTTTKTEGSPRVRTWYDELGREVQTETAGFDGGDGGDGGNGSAKNVYTVTTYDTKGRVKTTTSPFLSGETTDGIVVNTTNYDKFGRLETITNDAGTVRYKYNYIKSMKRLRTRVYNMDGSKTSSFKDATGKMIIASDESGESVRYNYYASGLPKKTYVGGAKVATMKYDKQGNQTELIDLNAGKTTYEYDAFGQLRKQTDAKGNTFLMQYDKLGRMQSKKCINQGYATNYSYVTSPNGINQLKKVTESKNGFSESYKYDGLGRLERKIEKIDDQTFTNEYKYDSYSRLKRRIYPSNLKIEHVYTKNGYLDKVKHGSKVLWDANAMNAYGKYTEYKMGHGDPKLIRTKTYDKFGYPTRFAVNNTDIQDLRFKYDLRNGNLLSRSEHGKNETFSYDKLDRLKEVRLNGTITQELKYWNNGNIEFKTDAGEYRYDDKKVHAVVSATNPEGAVSSLRQDITYTPFNSPETITESEVNEQGNVTGIKHKLSLRYGADEQRKLTIYEAPKEGKVIKKYFYDGGERIVEGNKRKDIVYVATGDGLSHIFEMQPVSYRVNCVFTDQLGSINTVTWDNGKIVATQSFDAWGRYRNAATWKIDGKEKDSWWNGGSSYAWLQRGFTGHEHLEQFGLINMNGRVYDPVLGRMLSPDNYVQSPTSTQSYNRYSYVLNNPLKYTDPTGEFWHIVIGAAVGGIINLAVKAYQGKIDSWQDGLVAFGIGAVAGAVGAATGGAAFAAAGGAAGGAGGFGAGAVSGMTGSAFSTAIENVGNAAYFGDPIMSADQYLTSVALGGVLGGTTNGIIAARNGRGFWNGDMPGIEGTRMTPIKPGPIANGDRDMQAVRSEINKAIPDHGPIRYRDNYLHKVTGPDGSHNWNRRSIEIVGDHGKVFPNFVGDDLQKHTLIQMYGNKHGTEGIYELMIKNAAVTHQRFIPGGVITGTPNQQVLTAPGGVGAPKPWWN